MRLLHASHRQRDLYLAKALIQAGHVVETLASPGDAAVATVASDVRSRTSRSMRPRLHDGGGLTTKTARRGIAACWMDERLSDVLIE